MAADNLFDLKIITPDRVFYSGKASFLELNTVEGEIGIYKNHIPMTTVLEPGIATITEEGGNKKEAALHTGFMEILGDRITILAEIAEWPDEIDRNRAQEAKIRAERRLQNDKSNINITRAELAAASRHWFVIELADHVTKQ